uniref:Uncharacterized protein n=1 Tax=Oryza glumipatula TaxID=40148 RepID=A0A0E0B728_9ORYZ
MTISYPSFNLDRHNFNQRPNKLCENHPTKISSPPRVRKPPRIISKIPPSPNPLFPFLLATAAAATATAGADPIPPESFPGERSEALSGVALC